MNTMRFTLAAAAIVLTASVAGGSTISVSVKKSAVEHSKPGQLLLVAFADEPVTADVNVKWQEGTTKSELPKLDPQRWWQQLTWTVRDTSTGVSQTLKARSIDVVSASRNPITSGDTAQLGGVFRIAKLPVGNYELRVSGGAVSGGDSFAIRNGDETPAIRDEYLRRNAEKARDYATFQRLQLERTVSSPSRADAWLALATRALEDGTAAEANEYYDKAIAVMEKNAAELGRKQPRQAKDLRKRVTATVAAIRALQAELPYYFASRKRLVLVEEPVDGIMRYVIKERVSGRVDRVILPASR